MRTSKKDNPPATCCNCGQTTTGERAKEKSCPVCGCGKINSDWNKPELETSLFLLQKEYLKTFDKDILGKMYTILQIYAVGKIKKIIHGSVCLIPEVLEEKASDAATLVIELYLRSKEFQIHTSFGSYLSFKVREVLWGYKEKIADDIESLQSLTGSVNTDWLIGTVTKSLHISGENSVSESNHTATDLLKGVMGIVGDAADTLREELSRYTSICVLLSLYLYIKHRGKEKEVNKYNELFRFEEYKEITDALLVDLMRFIRRH